MVRAYQMYRDDSKNAEFKFLHVFTRIEHCKKWADTRSALAKALSKGAGYNPAAPVPGAAEGRPELGQKAAKAAKLMGPPTERLQASLEKCMADARTHAVARAEKFDASWASMLKNQTLRIDLLKTTTTAKKRNTDWAFLMAANPEVMDDKVMAWYTAQRDMILNQIPATAASSTPSTPPMSTTADTSATSPAPRGEDFTNAEDDPVINIPDDPVITIAEEPVFEPAEGATI